MKKIAYTRPVAEMVLLLEDDVIRTSDSIRQLTDDTVDGLPTVNWKA